MAELFVGFAGMTGAALRLDDGENLAVGLVERVIGDAVPRLGVVAVNGNLAADLCLVVVTPLGLPQLGVDQADARQGFIHRILSLTPGCEVVS